MQWKVVFNSTTGNAAARRRQNASRISWVDVAYQPVNVAPVLDEIAMQDPGVRVQGFAGAPAGAATPSPVQLKIPQRPGVAAAPNFGVLLPGKVDATPQGFSDKGYASVLWAAHDDNDDDLVYAVYYRGESGDDLAPAEG